MSPYVPDPVVQERLAELDGAGFSVGKFDTGAGAHTDIPCRGKPIRFSRAGTLAQYIESALEAELSAAGKYDWRAPMVISGTINRVELKFDGRISSGAIGATWIMDIRLQSSNGRSLRAKSGSAYRTGFEVISCAEAAGALMPAVQKLIRTAVTQPQFALLTQGDASDSGKLTE